MLFFFFFFCGRVSLRSHVCVHAARHNTHGPSATRRQDSPDLERSGAEDARALVLGHEGGGGALLVGDLLVLARRRRRATGADAPSVVCSRVWVTGLDDLVVLVAVDALALAPNLLVRIVVLGLVELLDLVLKGGLVVAVACRRSATCALGKVREYAIARTHPRSRPPPSSP